MANEKKQQKQDPEVVRRKKEEAARRSRRRSRQLLGLVLTVLIIVGAVSIVGRGIGLVGDLLDDSGERAEYQQRIETMVWFDVLPFTDAATLDEATVKQMAIWGVYNDSAATLERYEDDALLIPVSEIDRYIRGLFGPGFAFTGHESFTEPATALHYIFLEDLQAYILPVTSGQAEYMPIVHSITRLSGGGRRVTVGYVSTRRDTGEMVQTLDYDHPAKYMDFIFYRDGSEFYLDRLERNTSIEVTQPGEETSTGGAASLPTAIPGEQDTVDSTPIPGDDEILVPSTPAEGGEEGEDPMEGAEAPEDE